MMQLLVKGTRKLYDKSSNMKMAIVSQSLTIIAIQSHTLIEKEKRWQRYSTNY